MEYEADFLCRYHFEQAMSHSLPETIRLPKGQVKYEFEATVERAGMMTSNLDGRTEVLVVRNPNELSEEAANPIAVFKNWLPLSKDNELIRTCRQDQLHYEMVIGGHSFPLNGTIDLALKFTPLAKVRLHRIRVYISENIIYQNQKRGYYRTETPRMYLLHETKAGSPHISSRVNNDTRPPPLTTSVNFISRNLIRPSRVPTQPEQRSPQQRNVSHDVVSDESLLGDIESPNAEIRSTEFEIGVPLPGCQLLRGVFREGEEKDPSIEWYAFHHDLTWEKANVTHWIKVVFRISREETNGGKRKFWDLNINAPIKLTSVYTHPAVNGNVNNVVSCTTMVTSLRSLSPNNTSEYPLLLPDRLSLYKSKTILPAASTRPS